MTSGPGMNPNTHDIMSVLVVIKLFKSLNKNCRGKLVKLYFSDTQGQLPPENVMVSDRIQTYQ